MKYEKITLYHHPLGIWLVTYETELQNLRVHPVNLTLSYPSGYDMRMVERSIICDYFENFKVYENGKKIEDISYLVKCTNYLQVTGIEWTMDEGSGIGFLNTWKINFEPEETKRIKITFNIIVTKPPIRFNPDNKEAWYKDQMNWLRQDYAFREENQFNLPINLGSFWALYPDSIVIRSYEAKEWIRIIDEADRVYKPEHITKHEFSEPYGLYSPPAVELYSPTTNELKEMSKTELMLLKNSFVAKYGRPFKNPLLKLFFSNQPWYLPNPDFHVWYLSEWDITNIRLINDFEAKQK